jgi:hypothetical protein
MSEQGALGTGHDQRPVVGGLAAVDHRDDVADPIEVVGQQHLALGTRGLRH